MSEKLFGGKVVTRTAQNLKKHPRISEVAKTSYGEITDLSGKHKVGLQWKLNGAADRDKVFKLTIDDKDVYLDLEELTYYTRIMFQ